jgi:hypothetical protein
LGTRFGKLRRGDIPVTPAEEDAAKYFMLARRHDGPRNWLPPSDVICRNRMLHKLGMVPAFGGGMPMLVLLVLILAFC